MDEILHQLIGSFPIIYKVLYILSVVQDFIHQQYHIHLFERLGPSSGSNALDFGHDFCIERDRYIM